MRAGELAGSLLRPSGIAASFVIAFLAGLTVWVMLLPRTATDGTAWRVDEAHKVSETYALRMLLEGRWNDATWFREPVDRTNPQFGKYALKAAALDRVGSAGRSALRGSVSDATQWRSGAGCSGPRIRRSLPARTESTRESGAGGVVAGDDCHHARLAAASLGSIPDGRASAGHDPRGSRMRCAVSVAIADLDATIRGTGGEDVAGSVLRRW